MLCQTPFTSPLMFSLMKWTDPSAKSAWTPPTCQLRTAPRCVPELVPQQALGVWFQRTLKVVLPAVRRIVDHYSPHTLILFTGNNEWLHWHPENQRRMSNGSLRLLRLISHSRALAAAAYWALKASIELGRSSPRQQGFTRNWEIAGLSYSLQHPSDDASFDVGQWLKKKTRYLDTFEANLQQMIQYARDRNVRVIVLTVPFNFKLSPAWHHPQPESFDRSHEQAVRQSIRTGARLLGQPQGNLRMQDDAAAGSCRTHDSRRDRPPSSGGFRLAGSRLRGAARGLETAAGRTAR